MRQKERGQSRGTGGVAIGKLALIALVVLMVTYMPAAQAKDEPEDNTRIYQHTYDEVFQACQDAVERMGLFLRDKDKDKGTISGDGIFDTYWKIAFDIRVETLNARPETRATINVKVTRRLSQNRRSPRSAFIDTFSGEVQKVLATYH